MCWKHQLRADGVSSLLWWQRDTYLSLSLSLSLTFSLTLFSWSPVEVTVYQSSHLFVSIHICLMFASEIGHVVGLFVWFVVCLYLNVLFFKIKQDHVYPFNHGFDLWLEDLVPWAALGRLYCQKTALVSPPFLPTFCFVSKKYLSPGFLPSLSNAGSRNTTGMQLSCILPVPLQNRRDWV